MAKTPICKRTFKPFFLVCLGLALLLMAGSAFAQDITPSSAGAALNEHLFSAQSALMSGDHDASAAAVEAAHALFVSQLQPALTALSPARAGDLEAAFSAAADAAGAGNVVALAAARADIWTRLLDASALQVYAAVDDGDVESARRWVLLREFRPATRFSRPDADATLALQDLAAGEMAADAALTAIHNDLLDTYQALLLQALANGDEAGARGFAMRRAEEAALAAGYFNLLAPMYAEQHGDSVLDETQAAFVALTQAAITSDADAFAAARTEVDAALAGFRAAPLSPEEAARRAGQLTRFLTLVPVEYERGVRDGQIVHDIEIQEALTFHAGAVAAFRDVESLLSALDAESTRQLAALLDAALAHIRAVETPDALAATVAEFNTLFTRVAPAEWQNLNSDADSDVILAVLDQVEAAVQAGQYAAAESARLEAYALTELGLEQRLNGYAPDRAAQIESLFWQGNETHAGLSVLLGTEAPLNDVQTTLGALRSALVDAQAYLNATKSAPEAVIGNAAIIVFREGLEAVLILASLLASLRSSDERQYRRPLIIGAALALVASGITWWLANQLLMSLIQYGERLEAVVSLIAIGVLLLITNWFFHKVYWTGWMASFHTRKRQILGGVAAVTISQAVGLVLLGFTSIYREGFETVLFLQSLVLETGIGTVLQGVAVGMVGVVIVGIVTFALQVRLPYKKMLVVTGVFIGVVLLTMVGNTVHVMQAVGWLPLTPIAGLQLPFWMGQWFGLFATWQGVLLQVAAAAFVVGSYFLAERQTKSRRQTRPERAVAGAGD